MNQKPNNPDWREATRMVDFEPVFGIACYEGEYDASQARWDGDHVGVVGSVEDAEAWLRGEDVKPQGVWGAT